jgi:hypothetical protein
MNTGIFVLGVGHGEDLLYFVSSATRCDYVVMVLENLGGKICHPNSRGKYLRTTYYIPFVLV